MRALNLESDAATMVYAELGFLGTGLDLESDGYEEIKFYVTRRMLR